MSKVNNCLGVMIAKGDSLRLPRKNQLIFTGKPMFLINLEKLFDVFSTVVFDSDDEEMIRLASDLGAITNFREPELRGHTVPSVPIFQSLMHKFGDFENMVYAQANSPQLKVKSIRKAAALMSSEEINELFGFFPDMSLNGAIWGLSRSRLFNYGDFYKPRPDTLILETCTDIHTQEEFEFAEKEFVKENNNFVEL